MVSGEQIRLVLSNGELFVLRTETVPNATLDRYRLTHRICDRRETRGRKKKSGEVTLCDVKNPAPADVFLGQPALFEKASLVGS